MMRISSRENVSKKTRAAARAIRDSPEHFRRTIPRWDSAAIENSLGVPNEGTEHLSESEVEHEPSCKGTD